MDNEVMTMKKFFGALVVLTLIVTFVLNIKPVSKWLSDSFWDFVFTEFDNEEKERQQKLKTAKLFPAKIPF
ncbi:MAG: hypothetical protein LIO59_01555 [Oscillospiraceae bacterium]|nr:hypothetical protein [Oscillospiraceae bacterium]